VLDRRMFSNPSSEYRGAPFWSINDELDPAEVARQVRLMVDAGFGGAFFHAREGLVTPFLGVRWFEAFEAAVKAAEERGAYVWIYDELRWPSGFAGGIVPALGPQARAKALVAVASERAFAGEGVVAAFRLKLDARGVPVGYERAEPGEVGKAPLYLTFVEYVAQPGETWYEGFCYVDLLDEQVVAEFLKAAYEPYLAFKGVFGGVVPGVFTDEPNIESSRPHTRPQLPPRGPRFPALSFPWTTSLPEKFKELNGYDLREKLPELVFELGDYLKTRYDFWRTVTLMFVEAFSKQIYEWCDRHGLKFTGHYLAEDTLLGQLRCAGSVMPHYEFEHVPGIDHLGFQIWGSLLTAKQVASVANQLGRERVLCETYGCLGNYPSFADRKWIGDFLYALGVNFLNHHLLPYSLRGRRKRDYGLNFHRAQPWWRYNRLIEDYFARLSYALSRGTRVANVLVLHPIGSAWALYSPLSERKVAELDEKLQELMKALLAMHVDFELGDEMLIAKHAKIEGAKLRVGRALYDAAVVPPSVTIASSTLKLLREFADAGGVVVFVEKPPHAVEGRPSPELDELVKRARRAPSVSREALEEALRGVPRPMVIEGDPDGSVLYHLRRDEDSLILFLTNTDRASPRKLRVGLEGAWKPELWDAVTGEVRELGAAVEGGRTWLSLELPPIGSSLLVLRPGTPAAPEAPAKLEVREVELGEAGWRVRRLDPNALVLDYCYYCVDGEPWRGPVPVWRAHREIASRGVGAGFALRFEFECAVDPRGRNIKLVIESPHLYEVEVNGKPVQWTGSWFDPSFRTSDVSELLVQGRNVIELKGVVGVEPELEPIYVMGDFGVEARSQGGSRIVNEKELVDASDLCREGLPFYAGSVELKKSVEVPDGFKRAVLRFGELNAALAEVHVNGVVAGFALFPPYEVDVTPLLKPGSNEIEIVLVGTLRNLFGPLHYAGGDPAWIGPETFSDAAHWTDEYVLRPFGFKGAKLILHY